MARRAEADADFDQSEEDIVQPGYGLTLHLVIGIGLTCHLDQGKPFPWIMVPGERMVGPWNW